MSRIHEALKRAEQEKQRAIPVKKPRMSSSVRRWVKRNSRNLRFQNPRRLPRPRQPWSTPTLNP